MSSTAPEDAAPQAASDQTAARNHESDVTKPNHDLPARTMAERERHEHTQREDPATMAASEELKHTTISDRITTASEVDSAAIQAEPVGEDKDMGGTVKAGTPEPEPTDAQDEEMRERLSSPKKKRGRDQDDDTRDFEGEKVDEPGSSADGSVVNGNRTTRLGPEKKRPRDTSEDPSKIAETTEVKSGVIDPLDTAKTATADAETSKQPLEPAKSTFGSALSDKAQTSSSSFASSGFGSLAGSSTSPFGALGASKPSVFGGSTQTTTSGFAALAGSSKSPSTVPASDLGAKPADKPATGFGFGATTTSGFGGLAGRSAFGSGLGNGFAGGAGPKLSSFAAPPGKQDITLGAKPAKAFGAPDSDEEEGSEAEDSDGDEDTDEEEGAKVTIEDKKRFKVTKVHIEDGESGEATLLQMRAKLFAIESKEAGWKERGVGTLKINVPKSCASYDENGLPISGSFDTSELDDEDEESSAPRVARLIMRQENTHRVILNTVIVRAMKFEDKPSTSSAQIIFTAFEGDIEPKPINMLLKMSEANARLFRSEIDSIQHEL